MTLLATSAEEVKCLEQRCAFDRKIRAARFAQDVIRRITESPRIVDRYIYTVIFDPTARSSASDRIRM